MTGIFERPFERTGAQAGAEVVRLDSGRRARLMGRGYSAAGMKAYYGEFMASSGSADYELSQSLERIRNKTRSLSRNSGTMRRYLQLLKDNVVGPEGFRFQCRVRKLDGTPDATLNMRVQDAWAEFCLSPTVDGAMDMVELQKQMVATWGRDGEFILEIVTDRDAPDGFLLNPVEGDMLDADLNTVHHATGNEIRMGVEITSSGRPVAYHFLRQHPGDASWLSPNGNRYRRVPADRVIHIYERLRPGQTRGEPPACSVPNTVKMLDAYREAEITSRRIKASAMGFMVKDLPQSQDNLGLEQMADRTDEDEATLEMDLEPGTFKALPPGYDFKAFDPGGSTSDYAEFESAVKTDASMGLSISPVSLGYETAKLSYSTHRGIIADDREFYRGLQSFFIRMGMRRILAVWLSKHLAFNVTSSIPPSRMLAILGKSKFLGRGWEQIDPTKDTKAENDQLAARTTSLTRIAAKRGMSRDELLDEIEDDERALKERGLTQSFSGASNDQQQDDGDDTGEDDEDDADSS